MGTITITTPCPNLPKYKYPHQLSIMACADISIHLADEDLALRLQLEEIEAQRACQTGKWVEGNTPDPLLAFNEFEAEIKQALSLSQDVKLAHSTALIRPAPSSSL